MRVTVSRMITGGQSKYLIYLVKHANEQPYIKPILHAKK